MTDPDFAFQFRPEAGRVNAYPYMYFESPREQKESMDYLKRKEELTGQPATLRSGTAIIGGTVVEN